MSLTLRELMEWVPEIADLAASTREAGTNHATSAEFYRTLAAASTWEGDGGAAARTAMFTTAADHEGTAENLSSAAAAMEQAHQAAETVSNGIKELLDYAAASPAVLVDTSTNQVLPPDTSYLDVDAAAQVIAKTSELQARIAALLAEGQRVDTDLASAIGTAGGSPASTAKSPTSLNDLLLPNSNEREPNPPSEPAPTDLDSALAQLAGEPADQPAGPAPLSRLDPGKVEEFKALARQSMQRDGVPADQIEERIDAMVAAAHRPLPRYVPPRPDPMPAPGFEEGFADRWFATEQGIKELIGQGGPGAPGVLESWRDLAVSMNEQLADPFGAAVDEVQRAIDSPSAAYYLGEKAADGAVAAPGLVFGGESALIARAGALDGIGPGIPHDLIDSSSVTNRVHDLTLPTSDPVPLVGDGPNPAILGPSPPVPHPLTADSPIFDGYDPTPPGPQFTNADGGLIYPDDSLSHKPYAVPGTVVDNADLPKGTLMDRFGSPYGAWTSPDGTPFPDRALPPDSAAKPYYQYVVADPSKLPSGFRIEQSEVAPWFHQPGGGVQYRIIGPDGNSAQVNDLLDSGYLRDVNE